MKTAPDVEIEIWLESLPPPPDGIEWDHGNERKNEKHDVTKTDIEYLLNGRDFVFAGQIIEPLNNEWRGLILGTDRLGRELSLVFTVRGRRLRPISCRSMRDIERSYYERKKITQKERPSS